MKKKIFFFTPHAHSKNQKILIFPKSFISTKTLLKIIFTKRPLLTGIKIISISHIEEQKDFDLQLEEDFHEPQTLKGVNWKITPTDYPTPFVPRSSPLKDPRI